MNRKKAKRIIKAIAKRESKNEKLIREEIKEAINIGYLNSEKQELWIELFGADYIPDPEEFIVKMSRQFKENMI